MIGLYTEPKPKGFGLGDTAFCVSILMASHGALTMAETRTRAGYARIARATIQILTGVTVTGVTVLLTPRLLAPRWDANDSASYPFPDVGIAPQ